MPSIRYVSATNLSLEQLTDAFNVGFRAYYLPMTQTPDSLAQMIYENDVRLDQSFALYVDDAVAGVGLVGVRDTRGWVAGMGVAPIWRGQGIGAQLLGRLLLQMREAGLSRAQLEALEVNTPAVALYQRLGFATERLLHVYHGPLKLAGAGEQASRGRGSLRAVGPRLALREFDVFHAVPPAWQRERPTVERVRPALEGLGLWDGGQLLAYVLYTRQSAGYAVIDAGSAAAEPATRRADLTRLLSRMAEPAPEALFRAINVPPGDALGEALQALGCPIVVTQREMARSLV